MSEVVSRKEPTTRKCGKSRENMTRCIHPEFPNEEFWYCQFCENWEFGEE